MSREVVLIFDIGKTNKKILLFDRELRILHEEETVFEEIPDDDGFPGDDIEQLEKWILARCHRYLEDDHFVVRGINFTTYGATVMFLDSRGRRVTPVYNYLKPMPEGVAEQLYAAFGGEAEFCRRTASPSLGMLNSGLQALWLKEKKPEVFSKVSTILHLPQYLSFLLTGKPSSEHTSIGCHTALWDFDRMTYHPWVRGLGEILPEPLPVGTVFPAKKIGKEIPVGIGIHDSSSSLVPYFMNSPEEFILLSTGTWCISMNPFNPEPLTDDQLKKDCLAYMSIQQKPVKSSRLFMGHIHDVNVKRLNELFGTGEDAYKNITPNREWIQSQHEGGFRRVFFRHGVPEAYVDGSVGKPFFQDFNGAYHQLVADLADLAVDSIELIIPEEDNTRNIYISGGFARNPIFLELMAGRFPGKKVFTAEVANATSLGAAMVLWKAIEPGYVPKTDLGLHHIHP